MPYAGKVSGLLQDLGMRSPPLGDVGIGQLIARVDRSWDARHEIQAQIAEHISELKQRALRTNELLVDLVKGAGAQLPPAAHWTEALASIG